MQTYKDKEKIEGEIGIISTFENETKIDVETELEVHGKFGIISKSNHIKTEEQKMNIGITKYVQDKEKGQK